MGDSEEEGNLVVDDGTVDDSICPVCHGSTYVGETISCETCTYWFHFECVGVKQTDQCVQREDVPFFCKKCSGKTVKRAPTKKAPKKAKTPKAKPKPQVVKVKPQVATPSPLKLKISFGKKKVAQRTIELSPPRQIPNKRRSLAESLVKSEDEEEESKEPKNKRKRLNSEDEEEKWLDAVESGNLHTVDAELKSINDPKTMTARQRAIIDRRNNDEYNDDYSHMSLAYIKKPKFESEEDAKIKAMKVEKRKEIEKEKREQDRIKTMERLLNKKETLSSKTVKGLMEKPISAEASTPKITYIKNHDLTTLTFPEGMTMPIPTMKPLKPPEKIKCAIKTCKNVKKYNCSKTGKPLCSLGCYKKNLQISV